MHPRELQPVLQSLLAVQANLDFAHASGVETVRNSDAEEWPKQTVIRRLEERIRALAA